MSGNRSRIDPKQMISAMVSLVYCAVALLAGYHTYNVFALADPPFFAFLGAVAVDGMLALTLYLIGHWYGDQRLIGFIGVILFAALSGGMQVIARKMALHEAMPDWLQFGADYAVPISVTLSLLVLGAIRYFDSDGNGVPDFMERGKQNQGGGNKQNNRQNDMSHDVSHDSQRYIPQMSQKPAQVQAPSIKPMLAPVNRSEGPTDESVVDLMSARRNGNGHAYDIEQGPRLVDPRNPADPNSPRP